MAQKQHLYLTLQKRNEHVCEETSEVCMHFGNLCSDVKISECLLKNDKCKSLSMQNF